MLQAVIDSLAKALIRRPGVVLMAMLGVILLSLLSVRSLEFSTDLFSMAPKDARIVQTFQRISSQFGNTLFVVVYGEEGKETDVEAAAAKVAASLKETGLFNRVRFQMSPDEVESVREELRTHVFNYRSVEEEPRLKELLDPEAISKRLRQVKSLLLTPFVSQATVLKAADPLRSEALNMPTGVGSGLKAGAFTDPDKTAVLIYTQPKSYPQDVDFAEELRDTLAALNAKMEADPETPAQLKAFGAHITVLHYGGQLKNDVAPAAISSVIGCSLFFFLLYRSWSIVLFTAGALAAGVLISLGVMAQLVGVVSPFSVGISALLVGTGIDHAIHFFNRYIEAQEAGKEHPVAEAISSIGVAVFLAALTTAGAFLFMLTSRFSGIRDYGLAGAAGVMVLLVTVLTIVPGLVQLRVKFREKHSGRSLRLIFPEVTRRRAIWTLVGVIIGAGALAPFAFRPDFNMDINSFRIPDPTYVVDRDELMGRFGLTGKTAVSWAIQGEDLNTLLDYNDAVTEKVKEYVGPHKPLVRFDSLSLVLPGPSRQRARLAALDPAQVTASRAALEEGCASLGLTDTVCEPLRRILKGAAEGDLVTMEALEASGLEDLLVPYLRQDEAGRYLIVGRMYPGTDFQDGAVPEALAADIESVGPNIVVAGPVRGNEELKAFFHTDLARVCAFAALGIILLLLVQYRKQPVDILLTLTPVALGVLLFVGLATLAGFEFGVLSLVIFPLVVGIGIDSNIHLTHHLHTDTQFSISEVLNTTGRALIASSLTTAIGCSANLLTSNPQVQDMGLLCAMGVLCCMVTSLLVWPSMAAIFFPRRVKPKRR